MKRQSYVHWNRFLYPRQQNWPLYFHNFEILTNHFCTFKFREYFQICYSVILPHNFTPLSFTNFSKLRKLLNLRCAWKLRNICPCSVPPPPPLWLVKVTAFLTTVDWIIQCILKPSGPDRRRGGGGYRRWRGYPSPLPYVSVLGASQGVALSWMNY